MERELTPSESLKLIETMIGQAKKCLSRIKSATLVILLVVTASLVNNGCSKDQLAIPHDGELNPIGTAGLRELECERVDFSTANIGQLHNDAVLALLNGVDLKNHPNGAIATVRDNFLSIPYIEPVGITIANGKSLTRSRFNFIANKAITEVIILNDCNFDIAHCSGSMFYHSSSSPYIVEIFEKIDSLMLYNNLDAFNIAIDAIRIDAESSTNCSELDLVIGMTEIAKYSAQLWMPLNKGGEGLFDRLVTTGHRTGDRTLENVVKSDVSASAGYWTCLGVGGMIGLGVPGSNAAILGGWAIAAAWGSATGAVGM